jgi:hypothetical protein
MATCSRSSISATTSPRSPLGPLASQMLRVRRSAQKLKPLKCALALPRKISPKESRKIIPKITICHFANYLAYRAPRKSLARLICFLALGPVNPETSCGTARLESTWQQVHPCRLLKAGALLPQLSPAAVLRYRPHNGVGNAWRNPKVARKTAPGLDRKRKAATSAVSFNETGQTGNAPDAHTRVLIGRLRCMTLPREAGSARYCWNRLETIVWKR